LVAHQFNPDLKTNDMKDELFVKMALDNWQGQLNATNKLFDKLTDAELMQEIAPSRNRGIYLLGHLAAIHGAMFPLLRFGDAAVPELWPIFVASPDGAVADIPSAEQLRAQWKEINDNLWTHFSSLTPEEWFARHASVTPEDFEKEPHRNRLNVLLSRTNHLSNHRGQLALLVAKGE
jgi:uncharacterized damage-inducible protein DinB